MKKIIIILLISFFTVNALLSVNPKNIAYGQDNEYNQSNIGIKENNNTIEKINMTKKDLSMALEVIYREFPQTAIDLEKLDDFLQYVNYSSKSKKYYHNILGEDAEIKIKETENIEILKEELKNKENEIKKLKELNKELKARMNITEANVEELKNKIEELEEKNSELKKELAKYEDKNLITSLKTFAHWVGSYSMFISAGQSVAIVIILSLYMPKAVNKRVKQKRKNMNKLKEHLTELKLNKEMEENLIDSDLNDTLLEIVKTTYKEMEGTSKITREDLKKLDIEEFSKTLNNKWKGLNKSMKEKIIKEILKLQKTYNGVEKSDVKKDLEKINLDEILEGDQ